MRNLLFVVSMFCTAPMAFADQYIYQCGRNDVAIVKKFVSGHFGYRREIGLFMFIFGDLANELQQKRLYPVQSVPGSNTYGLYWNSAVEYRQGDYGTGVRIANSTGPFFHYYLKSLSPSNAVLEVWRTSGYRHLSQGVGQGAQLVYKRNFSDCSY